MQFGSGAFAIARLASWVTGLVGLPGLLGLLAGGLGFLTLLERGLDHVVSKARRSGRSADHIDMSFQFKYFQVSWH